MQIKWIGMPMIIRYLISAALVALVVNVHAQGYAPSFPEHYIAPPNIDWLYDDVPKDIQSSRAFKTWKASLFDYAVRRWARVSLLDANNNEIILESTLDGTGGYNFLVLTKKNGKYQKVTEIFGAFIFYPVPSKNHTLVVYWKNGLKYLRTELIYRSSKYKEISSYYLPVELTSLENSHLDFYSFFWFLASGNYRKLCCVHEATP